MNIIRVVAFKEGDIWVAQCLERDICAQADDLDTLRDRIEVALHAERPLDRLSQAPKHFFDLWEKKSGFRKSGNTDGVDYEMALCA